MEATPVYCDSLRSTAIHEGAHVVFQALFGIKLESVTIIPFECDGKEFLGLVVNVIDASNLPPNLYWYRVTLYVASLLAGGRAEKMFDLDPECIYEEGASNDTAFIDLILAQPCVQPYRVQLMKNANALVSSMLDKPVIKDTILMVAEMLLAEGRVEGAKIEAAVLSVAGDYRLDEEFITLSSKHDTRIGIFV